MAPNCVNLSNPYHQCTQACSQSTNQARTHTTKKKTSGYGRSVTDGQLGKKMNNHKRTYSGCTKASNPYHQCDDNCYKRLSDSGAPPPVKFHRVKKAGSKPEPPILNNAPTSKVGAIYLSDTSPISQNSEKKKIASEPTSGQTHMPAVKPVNHKEQSKNVEHITSPIITNDEDEIASDKVAPINHVDDTGSVSEIQTINSSFSGIINEQSDEGEIESVTSEPRLQVGKYQIKQSFASILQSIFDKYGDIGASCHLESVVIRSYYIECVCFVVQELQSSSIMQLSKSKVKELLAILKDVESAQLRVGWLRSVLDELAENIELINHHQEVEAEKDNSGRQVETLRQQLESEMQNLSQKEQEVADIKTRIPQIRGHLSELELKASELNKTMLSVKSKLDNLPIKSLVDQLL